MRNPAVLATRYAGRPVLMLPRAAEEAALRLREIDARAFERPSRLGALIRKLSTQPNAVRPLAMEDDDGPPPVPFEERAAYAPLYAGEVEDVGYCWSLKDGVALMQCDTPLMERGEDVCGVVYHGYDTLLAAMREAREDPRVLAIFLRMASPGGVVAGGLADLGNYMRMARAAAGGKPIWVYADMACSAAYWIAAQADRIIAPKVGLVGSIGAVLVHEDWSGALEKAGVKVEAIQFGASKTDGAWWAALSPKARADLQAEIDQCGRNFVADVTAGRPKLTAEVLLATEAAVYMAEHDEAGRSGLALGFVDEIMGEADAFAALVAQVSSPATISPPKPAAPGGPQATTTKDKPMAVQAPTTPGRTSAQAKAEAARLRAQADKLDPQAAAPAPADDESLEDPAEEAAETPAEEAAEEVDETEGKAEAQAQAISKSAEGRANPAAALAAIEAGLTLEQFQAMAKTAGTGKSRLAVELAGAPRLGADAASGGKTAATRGAAATFARNLEAGRKPVAGR